MEDIFIRLCALLDAHQARYRVVEHPPAGKTEEVAVVRGTEHGQGAKALVCHIKGSSEYQYVLAILPADHQADLQRLAEQCRGKRASLASPKETDTLTHCTFGAIPPFSFNENLVLIADPLLFTRFEELAFNAGSLERSVILNTEDYRRIANPVLHAFARR